LPEPAAANYRRAVLDTAVPLIEARRWRIRLFTSPRASQGAALLRSALGGCSTLPALFRAGGGRRAERLLQEFTAPTATAVARHGEALGRAVDVKGEALRLDHRELAVRLARRSWCARVSTHLSASGGNA